MSAGFYAGHGLLFESDIPLAEFAPTAPGPADAHVRLGPLPEAAATEAARLHAISDGAVVSIGVDAHLVAVAGVADFLVTGGTAITVAAAPGVEDGLLRVWLHGSAMGMLLHQRGALVLHGAGVLTPHGVAIFVGESGAGKSTLAAHLGRAGFPVLGDDTLAVQADGGVWPGSRRLKLWRDAAEGLGIGVGGADALAHRIDKFWVDCPNAASHECLPLVEVIELSRWDGAPEFEVLPLLPATALIAEHTYRPEFVALTGREAPHFRQCAALAARVRTARLRRPWDTSRIGETAAFLARHWKRCG